MNRFAAIVLFVLFAGPSAAQWDDQTSEQAATAATHYQQYCALCHGEDRQGHVNDHAPSL